MKSGIVKACQRSLFNSLPTAAIFFSHGPVKEEIIISSCSGISASCETPSGLLD